MGYLSIKILTIFFSKIPKFSRQKWVECEIKKKNQTIICPEFLENKINLFLPQKHAYTIIFEWSLRVLESEILGKTFELK